MNEDNAGYEYEQPGIGRLALALSKAQGAMKAAIKDAENPAFKRGNITSKYVDLASAWEACRAVLAANELAVIQQVHGGPDPISVTTVLAHSSGETISSTMTGRPMKPDVQGIGSTVTYLRRYSLMAMVGIAAEDDDGNAASGQSDKAPTKEAVTKELERVQKPAKATYSLEDDAGGVTVHSSPDAFLDALGKLLKESDDPAHAWNRNASVISQMTERAAIDKNDKLLGRLKAAEDYANTRAAELNP